MTTNLADLHRSRLELFLAVEIEYQRKLLALSNQRIQELKRLLAGIDVLHQDSEGDELLSTLMANVRTESSEPTPAPEAEVSGDKKEGKSKKHKHKKAPPPVKPIRVAKGMVPRLIDALQLAIRDKRMGAVDAHAILKAKGWLPKSKDPLGYIRFTLSDEKNIFIRVEGEKGIYELDPDNPFYSGKGVPKQKKGRTVKAAPETTESEDPPKSSPKSSPKALAAPPPPPAGGSEPPPSMSTAESYGVVDEILQGGVPVDS